MVTGAGGCIGAWVVAILTASEVPVVALDLSEDRRRAALLMGEGGAGALYALSTAAATRLPAAASINNLQAPGPGSGAKAAESKDKLGNHTTANKSGAPAGGGKRL